MNYKIRIFFSTLLLIITTGSGFAQIHSIDLRSDLSSWLLLSPNIGVDINLNQRWSIGINGSYAHWHIFNKGHFPRISIAEATIRRYRNGDATFKDFYWGASLGMQWYDINLRKHDGWNGHNLAAGILAGYTLTLPSNWAFDAGIGFGYLYRDYKRFQWYAPTHMDRISGIHQGSALGITHLNISVIHRFKCR